MVGAEPVVLVIFVISFSLILSEKLHRTIAAWFGCVLLLALGKATGLDTDKMEAEIAAEKAREEAAEKARIEQATGGAGNDSADDRSE